MKHEQKVKFLKVWRKLWEHYNIAEVETYGEPWRRLKAIELRNSASYGWKGGPCDETGSFDITVKIPSEGRFKFTSYEIHFKIKPNFDKNFICIQQASPCYCDDKKYLNYVSGLKLRCKHEIAGEMALERDLRKILEERVKKGKMDKRVLELWIDRKHVEQVDHRLWYVRWDYPSEVFEFKKILDERFKKLKDAFFTALLKYSIFYYNLARALGKKDVSFYCEKDIFY